MKRSLVIVLSIVCIVAAFVVAALPRHNITPDAAKQIRVGMTRAEVEQILGGPPGHYYRWRKFTISLPFIPSGDQWIADDFAVIVAYDAANRVEYVQTSDQLYRGPRGFFLDGNNMIPEFVRNWLGGDFILPEYPNLLVL